MDIPDKMGLGNVYFSTKHIYERVHVRHLCVEQCNSGKSLGGAKQSGVILLRPFPYAHSPKELV